MGGWRKPRECGGFSSDIWWLFDPLRGTAVWARGMAQGPATGPGDSSVPQQGMALRWDTWSHIGTVEGAGREAGGCEAGLLGG